MPGYPGGASIPGTKGSLLRRRLGSSKDSSELETLGWWRGLIGDRRPGFGRGFQVTRGLVVAEGTVARGGDASPAGWRATLHRCVRPRRRDPRRRACRAADGPRQW